MLRKLFILTALFAVGMAFALLATAGSPPEDHGVTVTVIGENTVGLVEPAYTTYEEP